MEEWEGDEALRQHFATSHRIVHAGGPGDARCAAGRQVPHHRELEEPRRHARRLTGTAGFRRSLDLQKAPDAVDRRGAQHDLEHHPGDAHDERCDNEGEVLQKDGE